MKLLHLTACDFMVYKGYKIGLKLVPPIGQINFRVQNLTCSPVYRRVTIHHDILLKPFPSEFPYHIIHQLLVVNFLIDDLLFPMFIQARHASGISPPKIKYLRFVMVSLMTFSSSSLAFIQFRRCIFNSFAFSNNDVLLIYYFVILRQVTKVFFAFFLYFKKSIIIIAQHVALSVFCIGVFTLFNIYRG